MSLGRGTVELLFVAVALLAATSCIARYDVNLPVFAFLWFAFFHLSEDRKIRHQRLMISFILLTLLVDVLFVLIWPAKWFSAEWRELSPLSVPSNALVVCTSAMEVVLKCIILGILLAPGAVDHTTSTLKELLTSRGLNFSLRGGGEEEEEAAPLAPQVYQQYALQPPPRLA
eukprot:GHVT01075581.1.p1 GENE.GHVT01075581.1~~GHVT01075581.1.p1  ORF type:complete len:172 (+),score=38.79 GHVT01075581.1:1107-1622(+)